jgi:hypothetical protein
MGLVGETEIMELWLKGLTVNVTDLPSYWPLLCLRFRAPEFSLSHK